MYNNYDTLLERIPRLKYSVSNLMNYDGDLIIDFVNNLGYPEELHFVSKIHVNNLFQPCRTILSMINQCLTRKTSGSDKPIHTTLQMLWGVVTGTNVDYAELIWEEFIQAVKNFFSDMAKLKKYLEMAARKSRQPTTMTGKEVGKKKALEADDEPQPASELQVKDDEYNLQRGKGKGVVSDEQAAQSLLDLQKPKKKIIMDQYIFKRRTPVTQDASTGPSAQPPDDTSPPPEEDQGGSDPGQSYVAQAGPNPKPMHEVFNAIVYPEVHESLKLTTEEHVHIENPPSSSGTLSSMKNLEDAFTFGDQFLNDKLMKEEPGKENMDTEVKSMFIVPINQASSLVPPMSSPIIATLTKSHKRRRDNQDPLPPPLKNSYRSKKKKHDFDVFASKQPLVLKSLAWKTFDSREAPFSSSKKKLASPSEQLVNDDPIPNDMHLLESEDTGASHLLKIKTRPEWLQHRPEEETPKTLEPDWIGKKKLVKADFEGQAYKIVKPFHKNNISLKFQMEECHLLLIEEIDLINPEGNRVVHDMSKPLPLGGPPGQNQKDLPKDNPQVSVEVLRYDIKRSKSENKGIVPTAMELVLEQTQQDTSHEVSNVQSVKVLWDYFESKYIVEDAFSKKFFVSNFNNYKMVNSRPVMEQFNELLRILRQYTQHGLEMDEAICVFSVIDKLPPSWKDFKHSLKHAKDDLSLVQFASHLRIEESLRVQESNKGKGKEVARPSVNMMEEGGNNKNNKQNKGKKVVLKDNNGCYGSKNKPKLECWKCAKTVHFKRDCRSGNKKNNASASGSEKGSKDQSKDQGQNLVHVWNRPIKYFVSLISKAFYVQVDAIVWWIDFGAITQFVKIVAGLRHMNWWKTDMSFT
nr:hypothetical protein [Tanacetum cinerariifolium]